MIKKLVRLASVSAISLVPFLCHAQNLLVNGDLGLPTTGDVAPTNWMLDESPVPDRDPATLIDFADHTTLPNDTNPDNRGIWFKPFEGNFPGFPDVLSVDADLTQIVNGTPGLKYILTGWARFEGGYAGGLDVLDPQAPPPRNGQVPLTDTFFAIEFLDGANAMLPGGASLELKADGQSNNNQWMQHMLMAVAPAGTAHVRIRASMVDGEFNVDIAPGPGQSAFVDDFVLLGVPEPATWTLAVLCLALAVIARRR